jgi:4-amino-4-deoxy-L-arabinose transferase-like glycosyltransferase
LPLIDRDEPRFAEASREMIQRADYVVPRFNNQLRLDKPPLAYWAQVASYRIFGENDFGARFPSAIAAALTALVIVGWGYRIGAATVGWWAAIIFTLSLQTFVHAKAAVADMWLVLFMTLANWIGYELIQRPASHAQRPIFNSQWRLWWTFYLSIALGFLAKGPIAWMPLLTVLTTIALTRDWQLARHFKFLRGILLMVGVVALWGIPALIQTHGQFFTIGIGRHVIGRSLATMEGHGASSFGMYLLLLPFYFVTIFVSFFPWSIKLPALAKRLWRKRDAIDNYLISGILIVFVIMSLVKTKLPHYTLPAFPLLSLLLARHLFEIGTPKFARRAAIGAAATVLALAFIVFPLVAPTFPSAQLYKMSRNDLLPEMDFANVDYAEPSVVWYFRGRAHGFFRGLNPDQLEKFMNFQGPRFVIVPTSVAEAFSAKIRPDWKTYRARGFTIVKGRPTDLTLILKQSQ